MSKIYSTTKFCAFDNATKCDLSLDPGSKLKKKIQIINNNMSYVNNRWDTNSEG